MDGDQRLARLMWVFANHQRCNQMLKWCIDNKLTGKTFYEWADFKFGHKFALPVIQFIVKQLDRDLNLKPVLLTHLNSLGSFRQ